MLERKSHTIQQNLYCGFEITDQFDIDACSVKTLGGLDFLPKDSYLHAIRKLTQMIEQGVNEVPI